MSIQVHHTDMLAWLAAHDGPLFDSCVTDPPYHLTSIVKRFGGANAAPAQDRDGLYQRASRGFMGKQWDGGDIAFRSETWRAVYDRLKPGAHLVAFSGTRTYHRMACAIEDAGFEIRDQLAWAYGSGFPKSHNVGKSAPEWEGWGTALKPAWEPICLARKPLEKNSVAANMLKHGTGALNIDGCRIPIDAVADASQLRTMARSGKARGDGWGMDREDAEIAVVRSEGRFPANLLHDGSDKVLARFPSEAGAFAPVRGSEPSNVTAEVYGARARVDAHHHGDSGSAARFFYSAKAGPLDRIGSTHATIKPVDLMRWLVRLVTPPGGTVLEPFAGSGTTGIACMAEGFACTMLELEVDHVADIERKLAFLRGEGRARIVEHDRRRDSEKETTPDLGPLFAEDRAL